MNLNWPKRHSRFLHFVPMWTLVTTDCKRNAFTWTAVDTEFNAFLQGYGATEAGLISRMISQEECLRWRSVGRLNSNLEAKIVDHVTGEVLSVGQHGEFCVRGPTIMLGMYICIYMTYYTYY